MNLGFTLSSEEHGPTRLVELAEMAEARGFDFVSISDHYHPWISEQGHSPFVWSVLGGIAMRTSRIEVGVGVTCPIIRIHPAIVAHAAATTACLFGNRFVLGVGSGEALNEHILGDRWPPAEVRIDMLEEALAVMRQLWTGSSVTHRGRYFTVENARIFDLPDAEIPVVVSAFGESSASLAARCGSGLWTTGSSADIVRTFEEAGGEGPRWSQVNVCWAPDAEDAVETAHRAWPNTGVPGQLSQDLPTPLHFEQATSIVTKEMVAQSVLCGPDPEPIVEKVREMAAAGIDHVYFHQIGPDQEGFFDFWDRDLGPRLRDATR
jgi:coenzyme F420-dependent glucose-6-phosphate dehydrogenase